MFGKAIASLFALFFIAMLVVVSANLPAAAKGGRQNASATGTNFALVVLDSTDGVAHWGHQVTFTVSTTATTEPHVSLKCFQNGVLVYATQTGFYAGYLWPWTQVMTLSSTAWTGGARPPAASPHFLPRRALALLARRTVPP